MSMQIDVFTGPLYRADGGGDAPFRQSRMGALTVTDAHGRYYEPTARSNSFSLFTSAVAAPTASFPFAAAGTPLLAVYNPVGSGKNLSVTSVALGVATSGTTAAAVEFGLTLVSVLALGTGTATAPTSMISLQPSGSVARGFVNTVLTGNTLTVGSSILTIPIVSFGANPGTTAPSAGACPALFDIAGQVTVAPGNMVTLGPAATLAAANVSATLIWEEIPL